MAAAITIDLLSFGWLVPSPSSLCSSVGTALRSFSSCAFKPLRYFCSTILCGMLVVHWLFVEAPDALRAIGSGLGWPAFPIWHLGAVPAPAEICEEDSPSGAQEGLSSDISLHKGDVGVACRRDTQLEGGIWAEFASTPAAVAKAVVDTSEDLRKKSFRRS